MTSKFTELVIDCADPNGLARFWCSVLDYEVQDADDGIVIIGSPMVPEGKNHLGPVPPTLTFAHVPEGKKLRLLAVRLGAQRLAPLVGLCQAGKIATVIDRRYRLHEVPEALRYLGEGHAKGKIVAVLE